MKLLLLSNSTNYNQNYLEHAKDAIKEMLKDRKKIIFIPYALHDHDAYTAKVRPAFEAMGYTLRSIHEMNHTFSEKPEALFIGGGNTFRLLHALYSYHLIEKIREYVKGGTVYMGSSAGSNVACKSIMTTNDMPIMYPPSFTALNLVPFNINPHYVHKTEGKEHMGESRDQRIEEFLEENDNPVIGLPEGSWLEVENNSMTLHGGNAVVFTREGKVWFENADDMSRFL